MGGGDFEFPTPSSVCMISKTSFIKLRQSHNNVITHSCYLKIAKNGLKLLATTEAWKKLLYYGYLLALCPLDIYYISILKSDTR